VAKATQVEIDKRIEATKALLIEGYDSDFICQDLSGRYGVSLRQAERYLAAARDRLKTYVAADRAALFAEHIAHRRDMRRRAAKKGDLRTELAVAQDEAKLLDLYPADRHEHVGPGGGPIQTETTQKLDLRKLTSDELRTMLALSEKAAADDSSIAG